MTKTEYSFKDVFREWCGANSLSGHVWLAHLTQVSFQLMRAIFNELKKVITTKLNIQIKF
jgi:hypothetical protein